ncbi:hypothetical protein P168DRAFT_7250 [Aspergillus campestris IBT 28561]|uniref:Meiotically up-regulated protein Msb1/Mug8 domain-containing protein n=1 Tax=Aspergillus campestris (strain IBT 28561) TaxID=1392248 RepID=A0A2I1DDT1_ASPC2|nr:uncharacterized protein P168DRAFT_7250 [Aspergillus campestris IBT 28561]PKY08033.1 hypothetical protein P168DRAFT_7250 [Aspergillus campestris IBT 28561]
MPFFTRVFRGKDATASKKPAKPSPLDDAGPPKPSWTDAWQRTEVAPEEVQDLLRACTKELKARALQIPFLLLPFRPSSDASAARSFIRNYFDQSFKNGAPVTGETLSRELRLSDPTVLCSVLKWCWSRLPGGVVTWEAYELFKVGEQDSNLARDAFTTFIPISVDSDARAKIIFDFFDLLAAIAAHAKSNGLGGRKLSRYAGWWAFEHVDAAKGFEESYKSWASAADATSHLFFAYLRSLSPDSARGVNSIATLPITLQSLVQATEYPPETPTLLQVTTTKVVMIVDTVSPTPVALLRRATNFEYRDSDHHLQEFAAYDDPLRALTDECLRVLRSIAAANPSTIPEDTPAARDATWSRFEDIGFGGSLDSDLDTSSPRPSSHGGSGRSSSAAAAVTTPRATVPRGRPTTPSWADFMSSGFAESSGMKGPMAPMLLPPDKILPPLEAVRGQSSQSHRRPLDSDSTIEPAELASITTLDLDDSFWWVWISSLAGEEPAVRKAVFGRCALLETVLRGAKWLVLEEQVPGAAPEPDPGAYLVEKKRFLGFSTRKRLGRRKSSAKRTGTGAEPYDPRAGNPAPQSKTSIAPDQHARIQAAAAALQRKHREQEAEAAGPAPEEPPLSSKVKTHSVLTLQPSIIGEASQAMKWASNYDKHTYRTAYMSDSRAGTGAPTDDDAPAQRPPSPPARAPTTTTTTTQGPPPPAASSSSPVPPPKDETPAASRKGSTTHPPLESVTTSEPTPKPSTDSTDSRPRLKKKPGNSAFKSMFGTTKKKNPEAAAAAAPPVKPTGGSAVAAARAALEDKARASQAPPPVRAAPHTPSTLRKQRPTPVAAAAADAPPAPESPVSPISPVAPPAPAHPASNGGDHPRRDAEYDALSRVDTNEKAAADREFSRFDQGPLMDQPAFAPESPESEAVSGQPRPSAEASGATPRASESSASPANPSYDRWAQIRRNAAERAAQSDPAQMSGTDDGNTSEEESFETRAARIKARVAELTGNMQQQN